LLSDWSTLWFGCHASNEETRKVTVYLGCRWCRTLVHPDGRGNWIHISGRYRCRDGAGVPIGHYAEPLPAIRPAAR
jgi:hypothetical protein